MNPIRIQLSRRKGWRMPPDTISVARPGLFGNPFAITASVDRERAIRLFRNSAKGIWDPSLVANLSDDEVSVAYGAHRDWLRRLRCHPTEEIRRNLRGFNLACWCAPGPCHADVLLELANEG